MALIIKEIQVNTVIEKKVIRETEISEAVYRKIEENVIRKVSHRLLGQQQPSADKKKKER